MELLDVLPYEAALHRLMQAGVCHDDQMHDYFISQAFRGVTYAVNRPTVPVPHLVLQTASSGAPDAPGSSGGAAITTTGAVCVLCRMCVQAITSHLSHRTAAYLAVRLLTDEATAFGEGNERPCCTAAWAEAICSAGEPSYFQMQLGVNRRMALGYLYILAETVRAVARSRVTGKRLSSHFVSFTQRILDDVVPFLATMADTREAAAVIHPIPPTCNPSEDAISVATALPTEAVAKPARRAPTRLTVEANNTIIHLFHDISHDIMDVHYGSRKDSQDCCPVLDRDMPSRMWPAASIVQSALCRAIDWVLQDGLARARSVRSAAVQREEEAAAEAVGTVKSALGDVFTQVFKKQETLECSRRAVEREYGKSAKDYHGITDAMWANTFRLCFLCRNVTSAWIEVYGGCGYTGTRPTDKNVLSFIASFVTSIPSMDADENESTVLVASVALLSAALVAVVAAPLPLMQASLWAADTTLTSQVHNVIIQRGLRFRDELVQKLSALISQLILSGASISGAYRAVAESSDQLLELISNGRDAASQCVIRMLSRAVLERPYSMLPALFRLMQHGDLKTRRNVLDVLSALPQMDDDAVYSERMTAEQMRPMLRQLSEELLLRIQDEELLVRLQGSKLFAKVWPEDVVRPLLNLAIQKDKLHKKQSAAQQALRSVVASHTEDCRIVLLLLDESLALVGESTPAALTVPNTPADILAFAHLHSCVGGERGEDEGGTVEGRPIGVDVVSESTVDASGGFSHRLMGLVLSLVKRWADEIQTWSEPVLQPLVERVISARGAREQEFVVRVIAQVSAVSGATVDGAAALVSCVLRVLQESEAASLPSEWWLTVLGVPRSADGPGEDRERVVLSSGVSAPDVAYQMVAPFLCLRGCPRQSFSFCGADDMPVAMSRLWEFAWTSLFTCQYRDALSTDAQRLLLELICKYRTSMVLQRLTCLEQTYLRGDENTGGRSREGECTGLTSTDKSMYFFCRVGFFCAGTLLAHNKQVFAKVEKIEDGGAAAGNETCVASSPDGVCGETKELLDLVRAAEMVSLWTESVVFPWLLNDDDDEVACNSNAAGDVQRLSRSAIDCVALFTVAALSHMEFDAHVAPFVRSPLSELADLYREQARQSGHCADGGRGATPPFSNCSYLLGRFEFAIQVHLCVLNICRTSPMGRSNVCPWFAAFLPHFIELANASCIVASRLGRKDVSQVAVECCHVLFLAVMASIGGPLTQPKQTGTIGEKSNIKPLLMDLCLSDRNALLAFAVGSARYSTLPAVQSQGVKLLSSLIGAVPDMFVCEATDNNEALVGALSTLSSVALLHEDPQTRSLAEKVINAIPKVGQI